jgi:dGTPase
MGDVTVQDSVAHDFAASQQAREAAWLSPLGTPSYPARRERAEADCGLRTPFQRDRDRVVHSKAFRRLKHKTQVFVAPEGDHYRTRLTHTLEVTGISRTVARALRLNEDLTEAIGLGHDVGHPPFGHIGEDVLDRCGRERFGRPFRHNEHSLRVVSVLEGLNLTDAVRDGILRHSSGAGEPATLEGKIVRLVDRIAYINHDIDDALRAGVLAPADLPHEELAVLGPTGSKRIDALVHDLVEHSERAGDIVQGETVGRAMLSLRSFMFERVYLGPRARAEHSKIARVLQGLFEYYCEHPDELPEGPPGATEDERVVDYLAGMTDRFAIRAWTDRFVPQGLAL